jgi:hypothetical protein
MVPLTLGTPIEDNARVIVQGGGTPLILNCALCRDNETQRAAISALNAVSGIRTSRPHPFKHRAV